MGPNELFLGNVFQDVQVSYMFSLRLFGKPMYWMHFQRKRRKARSIVHKMCTILSPFLSLLVIFLFVCLFWTTTTSSSKTIIWHGVSRSLHQLHVCDFLRVTQQYNYERKIENNNGLVSTFPFLLVSVRTTFSILCICYAMNCTNL